jgi:hypothetical protein
MTRPLTTGVIAALITALGGAVLPAVALAQGFAAYISPPRFEVQIKAGEPLRQVLEIQHVGREKGNYRVYTNDWTLGPDNAVTFSNELSPDSCRPWVAIERRELSIEPGARYRYRFEISPPPGTAPRECRFALMVEGLNPAQVQGSVSFPVAGRIGVIVYARLGGAAPALSLVGTETVQVNGQAVAMLRVSNTGNATGRLEGFVNGRDAAGQSVELAPIDMPVLPGETRRIALSPVVPEGQSVPTLRFPLQAKGSLESGQERLPLDASFAP